MERVPKDFIDNPYWTFTGTESEANAFGIAACLALALKSDSQIEEFFNSYQVSRSDRKPWQTDLAMLWAYLTFVQPEDESAREEIRAFLVNFHFKDRFIETQLKQESNLFDEDIPTSDELQDWYTN